MISLRLAWITHMFESRKHLWWTVIEKREKIAYRLFIHKSRRPDNTLKIYVYDESSFESWDKPFRQEKPNISTIKEKNRQLVINGQRFIEEFHYHMSKLMKLENCQIYVQVIRDTTIYLIFRQNFVNNFILIFSFISCFLIIKLPKLHSLPVSLFNW